jgi:hypothetical protein
MSTNAFENIQIDGLVVLDDAEAREANGGIIPIIVGAGILILAAGVALYEWGKSQQSTTCSV